MDTTPHIIGRYGDLVAVFKPAGWRVHPAGDPEYTDLTVWLAEQDLPPDIAPAHRIDQGTSGIVLCGVDAAARRRVGEQFAAGEVSKTYLCLVHGAIRPKGAVRRALQDGRRGRKLAAETRYRRLELFERWALVEARPITGRKHQIRRHLQGLGHHIVGDERYGPKRFKSVPFFPGRMWLHATRLSLIDGPTIECPLPDVLEAHLTALREREALRGQEAEPLSTT